MLLDIVLEQMEKKLYLVPLNYDASKASTETISQNQQLKAIKKVNMTYSFQ